MSSSPFGDNASYTNSASKYWSDNDIKFGFKNILENNGKNNGFLTLEDINRFGYNMTEVPFANQMGLVNMYDAEYCKNIGGYPKGALVYGNIKGVLTQAMSLVDNNLVDFTTEGIDNVYWAGTSVGNVLMPSNTPVRKLETFKLITESSNSDIKYDNWSVGHARNYIADKDMFIGIDLSNTNVIPTTVKKTDLPTSVIGRSYECHITAPIIICFLVYIGNADQNPNTLTTPDPNFSEPSLVTNDSYITRYSPNWTCAQFAFPLPLYSPDGDYYLAALYSSDGKYKSTNHMLGCNDCIYVNKGDQLKIYPFYLHGNKYSGEINTEISLSEY